MAGTFRRISMYAKGRRNRRVCVSLDDLLDGTIPGTEVINNGIPRRIAWQDVQEAEDRSEELTREWMEKWQVPLVVPFGRREFRHRVETVKSAFLAEMDRELARDMRSYDLGSRRSAICRSMICTEIEKAACTLGILGF